MSPVPTAWTLLDGEKLKIFKAEKEIIAHSQVSGSIETDGKKFLKIATKDGYINLLDLQLTKRKRMDVRSFLNGYELKTKLINTSNEG